MQIDKNLQKESYNKAIKKVAANNDVTQKRVKEILEKTDKSTLMQTIKYAVENWTIEYYNRGIRGQ